MKCNICETEMKYRIEGRCQFWNCPNCGDSIVASYFEPIELDDTLYEIVIQQNEAPSKEQIKVVSNMLQVNFLEARQRLLDGTGRACIKAVELIKLIEQLKLSNLQYQITPAFPWN